MAWNPFAKRPAAPPRPGVAGGRPDFREIRELMFGDVPLAAWKPRDGQPPVGSWTAFEQARMHLAAGDKEAAVDSLLKVANGAAEESRQRLQAWTALRSLGESPPPEAAKQVLGVVLDMHLPEGLDTVAAYADGTARYINHGGKLVVWEGGNAMGMQAPIDALVAAGQKVANAIGPWEEARPAAPPKGKARLSMLTPSGLHFGQAGINDLYRERLAAPAMKAGETLLLALIRAAESKERA